jgi:hypothetical protein
MGMGDEILTVPNLCLTESLRGLRYFIALFQKYV